eukprot:TRINITY_DN14124_c0_g1_i1.p1 TRINITY_DN14124_c0_g1~~TRINITY_DN14124_c0_g1_i1.p1  ORF type:complete len:808 (-),score=123.31 TRINITY_DN14124_c0_g1_i1:317-2740(-)
MLRLLVLVFCARHVEVSAWLPFAAHECGGKNIGLFEKATVGAGQTVKEVFPNVCTSYTCREALIGGRGATLWGKGEKMAEAQQLADTFKECVWMAASVPQGEYTLFNFTVSGLPPTPVFWWNWVNGAFTDLHIATDKQNAVWFPRGAGVDFYVRVAGHHDVSSQVLDAALGKSMQNPFFTLTISRYESEQLMGTKATVTTTATAAEAPTTAAAKATTAPKATGATTASPAPALEGLAKAVAGNRAEPAGRSPALRPAVKPKQGGAAFTMDPVHMGIIAGVVLITYLVLVILAATKVPFLKPFVLCWPDVCMGRGCCLYRLLCCPFVLPFHAVRIYCVDCIGALMAQFCKCCRWEFDDKDFPANDQSIGKVVGDTASGVRYEGKADWARATEIAVCSLRDDDPRKAGGAMIFEGKIEPADVLQGSLGDCWLMAAFAALAERPGVLQQAFLTRHVDLRGKYRFRLWDQIKNVPGERWVEICVDDKIPVKPGTLTPKFSRTNSNEMWVLLLEKAFAKLYGNYSMLDGGQTRWALSAVTGNPAMIFMRGEKKDAEWAAYTEKGAKAGYLTPLDDAFSHEDFFKFLHKANRQGAFITCAGLSKGANPNGLIDGHAYSVLQLRTVHKSLSSPSVFRLVQIRNPHGRGEWKGAWSDDSKAWQDYPYVKKQLYGDSGDVNDGSFWMQWEDFIAMWRNVDIVDCDTNIWSVGTPIIKDESKLSILKGFLSGCCNYWCCCLGLRRLYFGRAAAQDLEQLKKESNSNCGIDQQGFYCNWCERGEVSVNPGDERESLLHGGYAPARAMKSEEPGAKPSH